MRKLLALALAAVALATPAHAFGPSAVVYHPTAAVRSTAALSSIADISVSADLDATLSGSYAGTGTSWASVVTSPADGSTQAANAYSLNATFSGPANNAAAYFSVNGSQQSSITGGNTSALATLQNDASSWWVAMTFNLGANTLQALWSTQNSSSTAGLTMTINGAATPRFTLTQYTTASKQVVSWSPTSVPAAGVEYIVVVSHSAGANTRVWFNSPSNMTESSTLFTSGSGNASHAMEVGGRSSSTYLTNNSHFSNFSYGTGYLTSAQAGEIIHLLENRHQVDYDANGTIGN